MQTDRYGYSDVFPNFEFGSLGILSISSDRMLNDFIAVGTQDGIMPRSSPQTSISVDEISEGSFFIALLNQ